MGISEETLRDYVARGCPHDKGGPGRSNRFDPTEVVAWMRSQNLTGKPGRPATGSGNEDLESVRIRKETAMAVNWEYRNKVLEGELVKVSGVTQWLSTKLVTAKNKLIGMSATLPPRLYGKEPSEQQAILEEEIDRVLTELSNYTGLTGANGGKIQG